MKEWVIGLIGAALFILFLFLCWKWVGGHRGWVLGVLPFVAGWLDNIARSIKQKKEIKKCLLDL